MVNDITLSNRYNIQDSNIGAIICHTPKTLYETDNNNVRTGHTCAFVKTVDELEKYFGDPYVDPSVYSDLIIAHDLVKRGIPMYISSVYEMKDNDDGFEKVLYNGYTEFYFKENGYDNVGYKLKSETKFCQPLISKLELSNESHQLHVYVQLYCLDRGMVKKLTMLNKPDASHLYKIVHFTFDADTVSDKDIIDDFDANGLELHVVYSGGDDYALSKMLIKHAKNGLKVLLRSLEDDEAKEIVDNDDYRYDIHSSDYAYDFNDEFTNLNAYKTAIESLSGKLPEPLMLCLGKMYHSIEQRDTSGKLISSKLEPLDVQSHFGICNILMDNFTEDCHTYLFINTPDVSVSSVIGLLNNESYKYSDVWELHDRFNCDLFFGYATDYVDNSFVDHNPRKVVYSAALLSFYNLMLSSSIYLTNNFIDLNISNRCVKIVVSERSAQKLRDSRCNSMVLFDIGRPSVYGDRSLSSLPNLRYSHISRNFVRIRRLIHEYLETRKFILNTVYNIESTMAHIRTKILDEFVSQGVLSNYSLTYSVNRQSVYIKIILIFSSVTENIILDFTI